MTTSTKPTIGFWIIATVALLWNLMGVSNYISQVMMTTEMLDAMPELQRTLIETRPAWATGAFATAVFAGAFGSILLLLKRKAAYNLFLISIAAILVQLTHAISSISTLPEFGPAPVMMLLIIPAFGLFLIFYTKRAAKKGWLK